MTNIVERLREETDELTDALEMVTAENKRMREALREISTRNFSEGTATLELRKIARAALEEKE